MDWTPDQDAALRGMADFFANPDKQVLTVAGPAGAGKSTVLSAGGADATTAIVTPTAKAARILHRLGLKRAQSCHSLIYTPLNSPTGECRLCGKQFRDGDHAWVGEVRGEIVRYACDKCRSKLTNARSWCSDGPCFKRREHLDVRRIVIDEASMVGKRLAADILSFRLPVLAVGDGYQLPPISDEPAFDLINPDIALTEIHRQAFDSPIIAMAEVVRLGAQLEYGTYGESRIVRQSDVRELAAADQVIIGRNRTRMSLNQKIRRAIGFESALPEPGDRVVCLRNNYNKGIVNGSQWSVENAAIIREEGAISDTLEMELISLDDPTASAVTARTPTEFFTRIDAPLPWYDRKELDEFTFANAITAHKAQGSEWPHVVVLDESGCFGQDAQRWLYTAITRASDRLTLVM